MRGLGSCASGQARRPRPRRPSTRAIHGASAGLVNGGGFRIAIRDADRDDRSARRSRRSERRLGRRPRRSQSPEARDRRARGHDGPTADRTPRRRRTPSRCRTASTAGGWPEPRPRSTLPTPASARERIGRRRHAGSGAATTPPPRPGPRTDTRRPARARAPARRTRRTAAARTPRTWPRWPGWGAWRTARAPLTARSSVGMAEAYADVRRRFGPRDSVERRWRRRVAVLVSGSGTNLQALLDDPADPAPPGAGPVRPAEREGPRSRASRRASRPS